MYTRIIGDTVNFCTYNDFLNTMAGWRLLRPSSFVDELHVTCGQRTNFIVFLFFKAIPRKTINDCKAKLYCHI